MRNPSVARRLFAIITTFLSFTHILNVSVALNDPQPTNQQVLYRILGVSGTLQNGFPLRPRLDWRDSNNATHIVAPAIFVGTGLVRGYKAYLDIKNVGSREYIPPCGPVTNVANADSSPCNHHPAPPQIPNAVVMPTGCRTDANVYHVFAVPEPVLLQVLLHEPRYLSITPDTGLVDLVDEWTSLSLRRLVQSERRAQQTGGYQNLDNSCHNDDLELPPLDEEVAAISLVTGVYFDAASFVESPAMEVHSDGTRVYSYDGGLLRWSQRPDATEESTTAALNWTRVHSKVRRAEEQLREGAILTAAPWTVECADHDRVEFGSKVATLRLNYPLTRVQVEGALQDEMVLLPRNSTMAPSVRSKVRHSSD